MQAAPLVARRASPRLEMPVGNLAQDDVVTAARDTSIQDLADTMESEQVGSIVVTEDDQPVGIVTDRAIALSISDGNVESRTAEDVMTEGVATIQQDAEAVKLAKRLGDENVRRLPVVDDNEEVVGIVTLDDLVSTIGEQLDEVADVIEAQSPGYSPEENLE